MRNKGRITSWNDEKGFGFISPIRGGDRTFVHIKAFENRSRRPVIGDVVTYSVTNDDRGRPRAERAIIAGVPTRAKPKAGVSALPWIFASGFLLMVCVTVLSSMIPVLVLLVYLGVSAVTFAAYALDKMAAKRGDWRTSENTLHMLALFGGWPGALIAQSQLRHKTRKQPFRTLFWATVVLNCAAFVWLFTPEGEKAWRLIVESIA